MLLVRVHSSIKEIESLSMTEIFTSQILGKKEQQQKVLNLTFFSGFLSCQKSSQPDIGQITSRITNIHLDIQPFSAPITKYALGKIKIFLQYFLRDIAPYIRHTNVSRYLICLSSCCCCCFKAGSNNFFYFLFLHNAFNF